MDLISVSANERAALGALNQSETSISSALISSG